MLNSHLRASFVVLTAVKSIISVFLGCDAGLWVKVGADVSLPGVNDCEECNS